MALSLEQLAHERSSDKRRELLNNITAMFLDGADHHTDREQALYAEVALRVLGEITTEDRAAFSDSIADEAALPGSVVRHLAHDEVEVASPVLSRSPVLTDEDLVAVARSATQEHLHAISNRPTLSETVTDTLVEHGDRNVVCAVTVNPGARFSIGGLTTVTERSANDEEMRSNLLRRADLRELLVEKVLPMVSSDYADRLRGMIDNADDETIGRAVDAAQSTIEAERSGEARRRLETRMIIREIENGTRHIDDAIVYLADQARTVDIVMMISRLTDIAEKLVRNVLFKPDNEPVAIIARALGASATGFKALQELRARKLYQPRTHLEQGMRTFAELDELTAKRSLRFVKVRSEVA
jgi:uncharacterized protein (DUF2336 family)